MVRIGVIVLAPCAPAQSAAERTQHSHQPRGASAAAQVLTVWLGTFLVGSFFSQFHQWLDNPSSAVNLLGTAVPQTASFFLTYLALSAFWTTPFGGLGIVGLILYWVKGKIAATEAARARLWQEQYAKYGADVRVNSHLTTSPVHPHPSGSTGFTCCGSSNLFSRPP